MSGTIVDVVVIIAIAVVCFFVIRYMVDNVRNGRSIDGCTGDCSHCSSCGYNERVKANREKQAKREAKKQAKCGGFCHD